MLPLATFGAEVVNMFFFNLGDASHNFRRAKLLVPVMWIRSRFVKIQQAPKVRERPALF